jgi:hypothetical protein
LKEIGDQAGGYERRTIRIIRVASLLITQPAIPKYNWIGLRLESLRSLKIAFIPNARPITGRTTGTEVSHARTPKISENIPDDSMYEVIFSPETAMWF